MVVRGLFLILMWWAVLAGVACGGSGGTGAQAASDASSGDVEATGMTGDSAPTDALVPQMGDGSSGEVGVFDCALAASNNCWKTTVLAAVGCVPPSSEMGTLSGDGLTCTYPSGTVVTFATPLVPPNGPSTFTVTTNGTQCLHDVALVNGSIVTTSAGSVSLVVDQDAGTVTLGCPDGTTCRFAASCSHLKGDFRRVMQPPDLQPHAATRERD